MKRRVAILGVKREARVSVAVVFAQFFGQLKNPERACLLVAGRNLGLCWRGRSEGFGDVI
jgi:hypothetical protein